MSFSPDTYPNKLKERINHDFVSIIIEKILMDISPVTYDKVMYTLEREQKYPIYEYPEELKKILKELFGESHTEILNKIKTELHRHVIDKEISRFVTGIDK